LIVPDQVAHQNVQHIIINWNCSPVRRHAGQNNCYTD
jgi:hypothetical protein